MAGKHRVGRLARRGRRVLLAGALAVSVIGGVAISTAFRGPSLVVPGDACAERPPLQTWQDVTLQPLAMTAFRAAQREAGVRIPVVQSYRSCREQRMACQGICGNPDGCKDTCAAPGRSWHQLGAAIDITQAGLDDASIPAALENAGWCQALPATDPGHFSYGGCH